MRPEDFSPGNAVGPRVGCSRERGFNEAGGFLPRKPGLMIRDKDRVWRSDASMRPEDFSPGNNHVPVTSRAVIQMLQ